MTSPCQTEPDSDSARELQHQLAARRRSILVLISICICVALGLLFAGPIPQPPAYHAFSDARTLFGIPNALNVLSNLPFLLIGLLGIRWLVSSPSNLAAPLRLPYTIVFAGLIATAFGSAYYHLAPSDATLLWDRMPIAVSFMALFAALLAERISISAVSRLTWLFAIFGAVSALYWAVTGDLRPYLFAQFAPVLSIPLLLWLFSPAYSRGSDLMVGVAFYAAAKLFEDRDGPIYHALDAIISGHTLKHFSAAMGAYWIYRMLRQREAVRSAARSISVG